MKMNLFDKFLLALLLLLLLALSIFIGCVAVSAVSLSQVTDYLGTLKTRWDVNMYLFGGVALLLFVITVRLFVASYGGDRSQSYTRIAITDNGEIAISIPTIKQITAAYIAGKPEIAASASDILPFKDGLVVHLRVCMKEGVTLPDVTAAVQKELKAHLETVTGLVIKKIHMHVDNNRSNYSGKGR